MRFVCAVLMCCLLNTHTARATVLVLKSGLEVKGQLGKVSGMGQNIFAGGGGNVDVKLIVVADDGLRRAFVSTYQVENVRDEIETPERIRLDQPIARRGLNLGRVGPLVRAPTPFDQWGRRKVSMMTQKGRLDIVQGITEVTPLWTRVRGLQSHRPVVWDMRVATSSLPRETLSKILKQHLDPNSADDRLAIVRLYLQAERYGDAEKELKATLEDFPELTDLTKQLRELHQLHARQQLDEIRFRRRAGQHRLARHLLETFPAEDVAGETLEEIRELITNYDQKGTQAADAVARIGELIAGQPDGARKVALGRFHHELQSDLRFHTLVRLADFLRLSDDASLDDEQKLSLALSGWLLGGSGTENLTLSLSLLEVRRLIAEYLLTEDEVERGHLLDQLKSQEGASPQYVAKLLAAMKPPHMPLPRPDGVVSAEPPEEADPPPAEIPGLHKFVIDGVAPTKSIKYAESSGEIAYYVQLPPEYDPLRRYPTIVTLHGAGSEPPLANRLVGGGVRQRKATPPRPGVPAGVYRGCSSLGREGTAALSVFGTRTCGRTVRPTGCRPAVFN